MITGGTQGNRTGRKLGHDSDLLCSLQAKFTVAVRIAPRRECTRVLTRSVEETGSNPTSSRRTPAGYAVVAWVTYSSTRSTIIYEKIDKWPRLTRNQLFMLRRNHSCAGTEASVPKIASQSFSFSRSPIRKGVSGVTPAPRHVMLRNTTPAGFFRSLNS